MYRRDFTKLVAGVLSSLPFAGASLSVEEAVAAVNPELETILNGSIFKKTVGWEGRNPSFMIPSDKSQMFIAHNEQRVSHRGTVDGLAELKAETFSTEGNPFMMGVGYSQKDIVHKIGYSIQVFNDKVENTGWEMIGNTARRNILYNSTLKNVKKEGITDIYLKEDNFVKVKEYASKRKYGGSSSSFVYKEINIHLGKFNYNIAINRTNPNVFVKCYRRPPMILLSEDRGFISQKLALGILDMSKIWVVGDMYESIRLRW